jgi:ubiquinone/menaquinone biosynthesis C-methylase UbiE
MFFLRKSTLDGLPVAMSGARMGERVLQIGIDDDAVAGAIAAKVGLSGHAAIAVNDERHAARARAAGETAGVLIDVQTTSFAALPFPQASFDAVVLHAGDTALPPLDAAQAAAMLTEASRVLRAGGRIVIVEGRRRRALAALIGGGGTLPQPGAAVSALGAAGFRATRELAEREGYRFTEGLK